MKRQNRRLLISLSIVLVWLGFITEGSHALFSDSASLTGNAITAGTADLQVSNSQNGSSTLYADSRPGFSYDLTPGQSDEKYFFLKNLSSSDFSMAPDLMVIPQGSQNQMYTAVSIEVTPVDENGTSMGESVSTTLSDATSRRLALKGTLEKGKAQRYKMVTGLSNSYTLQGQSINYDLFFTGTQKIGG